jgi:alpha-ketoglutarate-dependent taurine dioxygenase
MKFLVDHRELQERGWTIVPDVRTQSRLLEVARSVGRPVLSPTGELIKKLYPHNAEAKSNRRTLSVVYGMDKFPLHTDTAFWPLPCRYIVFRATGDIRRGTTILTFATLVSKLGIEFQSLAERSVWVSHTPQASFYCLMIFSAGGERCWRYDPHCMQPANKSALQVNEILKSSPLCDMESSFIWAEETALVVDNWKTLHGRGPMPANEQLRVLERIYLERQR